MRKSFKGMALSLAAIFLLSACSEEISESKKTDIPEASATTQEENIIVKDNIELSNIRGEIGEKVDFTVKDLTPNEATELVWIAVDGKYLIEDLYVVNGADYTESEIILAEGTADADGKFTGSFEVPDGFGWDHTVRVKQKNQIIGQTNYTVVPVFEIFPKSGPIGTEITIKAKGIGWSTYMRNWQVTYDNKYTGIMSAVSTNGSAEGVIRAAGTPGDHVISIRTGYLGMPYINQTQSPRKNKPTPDLVFTITDEAPVNIENRVEEIPVAADGGVEMPELTSKDNVKVGLNIEEGVVGEPVTLTATGLPKDAEVELIWNTMVGSRVSGLGFEGQFETLDTVKTDVNGQLKYDFTVPDDLGGIPHRLDVKVGDDIYGQAYLRILPSIVDFSPKSGPVGTKIKVIIKGGGWTEFDNAYYMTYDNAYIGYMCSFNSQGTLEYEMVATGEPGLHLIDLYPGIYRWAQTDTDPTLIPQLAYKMDHPGSAMPAVRLAFEITK
ncbi:hypothetical protein [Solibacillus sp. CAU 1738]|uniref:hypothetical protein n=1 Tax=Solibacillus sp. CAU 1738 TaxID=3140363 RepID=UPI0032605A00